MTPFRDRFITYLPTTANPVSGITGHEITPHGVGITQQQVDDQVLEVPDVRHIPDAVASLLSYRQLEKQGFKIQPVAMEDGTSLFEITDLQGQTFRAIPSSADVYPINGVTNPLAMAAKAKKRAKPAGNPNETTTVTTRPIYEPIEVWHSRLGHLNADDIIRLAKEPRSGIKIKGSKALPFCEICKLAGSQKKLSKRLI